MIFDNTFGVIDMDKQVAEYIEKQKSPQKEILQKVRKIFRKTLPDCNEKFAWGVVVYASGKFYIAAMKNRVHVGFAINGLNKEKIEMFEGSGRTMRHIKIHSLEDIKEERLVKLINMVNKKATCPPDFKG
jgi:hypothetical protein